MATEKLKALVNTVIKQSTNDSSEITDPTKKFSLVAGSVLEINSYNSAANNHWELQLTSPVNGVSKWFAYQLHVEIRGNSPVELDKIIQVAATSEIAHYHWLHRGVAPRGYIKGMAVVYARVYCQLKAGDAAAIEMAKANTGKSDKDALAHYAQQFQNAGMDNGSAGVDTLRHLFVLLIGLGMRESSGRYCEGRDASATNTTAETAEAGLFQTSYNARSASPLLPQLFKQYLANPLGFLEIFKEGVSCSDADLKNAGEGNGKEFQRLSKSCPAFTAEFAAVGLRNVRKHWGPINRKEAEVRPEADAMLLQVQNVVDDFNLCPALH